MYLLSTVLGSDQRSVTLTLSLTLPDLNLTIFPSIPCLVSGRRSESIIFHLLMSSFCDRLCIRKAPPRPGGRNLIKSHGNE